MGSVKIKIQHDFFYWETSWRLRRRTAGGWNDIEVQGYGEPDPPWPCPECWWWNEIGWHPGVDAGQPAGRWQCYWPEDQGYSGATEPGISNESIEVAADYEFNELWLRMNDEYGEEHNWESDGICCNSNTVWNSNYSDGVECNCCAGWNPSWDGDKWSAIAPIHCVYDGYYEIYVSSLKDGYVEIGDSSWKKIHTCSGNCAGNGCASTANWANSPHVNKFFHLFPECNFTLDSPTGCAYPETYCHSSGYCVPHNANQNICSDEDGGPLECHSGDGSCTLPSHCHRRDGDNPDWIGVNCVYANADCEDCWPYSLAWWADLDGMDELGPWPNSCIAYYQYNDDDDYLAGSCQGQCPGGKEGGPYPQREGAGGSCASVWSGRPDCTSCFCSEDCMMYGDCCDDAAHYCWPDIQVHGGKNDLVEDGGWQAIPVKVLYDRVGDQYYYAGWSFHPDTPLYYKFEYRLDDGSWKSIAQSRTSGNSFRVDSAHGKFYWNPTGCSASYGWGCAAQQAGDDQWSVEFVNLMYLPDTNFFGPGEITVRVRDYRIDASVTQTAAMAEEYPFRGNHSRKIEKTIPFAIGGVNDPPICTNKSFTIIEDYPISTATPGSVAEGLLAGATDVEDTDLDAYIVPGDFPQNGTLTGENGASNANSFKSGAYTYTPDPNFNGTDSFTFYVRDSDDTNSNPCTVSITVTAVNDPPILNRIGTQSMDEGSNLTLNPTASDVDNDNLTWSVVSNTDWMGASIDSGNGVITLTPANDAWGIANIEVKIDDNSGEDNCCASEHVSIVVSNIVDIPGWVSKPGASGTTCYGSEGTGLGGAHISQDGAGNPAQDYEFDCSIKEWGPNPSESEFPWILGAMSVDNPSGSPVQFSILSDGDKPDFSCPDDGIPDNSVTLIDFDTPREIVVPNQSYPEWQTTLVVKPVEQNASQHTVCVRACTEITDATSIDVSYDEGWNLVSLPIEVEGNDYDEVFPDAILGTLYTFEGTYSQQQEMIQGKGYWLKFEDAGTQTITGTMLTSLSIDLDYDWNLIAGHHEVTEFAAIIQTPSNCVVPGTLYGFPGADGGYYQDSALWTGTGYWLRADEPGCNITIPVQDPSRDIACNDLVIHFDVVEVNDPPTAIGYSTFMSPWDTDPIEIFFHNQGQSDWSLDSNRNCGGPTSVGSDILDQQCVYDVDIGNTHANQLAIDILSLPQHGHLENMSNIAIELGDLPKEISPATYKLSVFYELDDMSFDGIDSFVYQVKECNGSTCADCSDIDLQDAQNPNSGLWCSNPKQVTVTVINYGADPAFIYNENVVPPAGQYDTVILRHGTNYNQSSARVVTLMARDADLRTDMGWPEGFDDTDHLQFEILTGEDGGTANDNSYFHTALIDGEKVVDKSLGTVTQPLYLWYGDVPLNSEAAWHYNIGIYSRFDWEGDGVIADVKCFPVVYDGMDDPEQCYGLPTRSACGGNSDCIWFPKRAEVHFRYIRHDSHVAHINLASDPPTLDTTSSTLTGGGYEFDIVASKTDSDGVWSPEVARWDVTSVEFDPPLDNAVCSNPPTPITMNNEQSFVITLTDSNGIVHTLQDILASGMTSDSSASPLLVSINPNESSSTWYPRDRDWPGVVDGTITITIRIQYFTEDNEGNSVTATTEQPFVLNVTAATNIAPVVPAPNFVDCPGGDDYSYGFRYDLYTGVDLINNGAALQFLLPQDGVVSTVPLTAYDPDDISYAGDWTFTQNFFVDTVLGSPHAAQSDGFGAPLHPGVVFAEFTNVEFVNWAQGGAQSYTVANTTGQSDSADISIPYTPPEEIDPRVYFDSSIDDIIGNGTTDLKPGDWNDFPGWCIAISGYMNDYDIDDCGFQVSSDLWVLEQVGGCEWDPGPDEDNPHNQYYDHTQCSTSNVWREFTISDNYPNLNNVEIYFGTRSVNDSVYLDCVMPWTPVESGNYDPSYYNALVYLIMGPDQDSVEPCTQDITIKALDMNQHYGETANTEACNANAQTDYCGDGRCENECIICETGAGLCAVDMAANETVEEHCCNSIDGYSYIGGWSPVCEDASGVVIDNFYTQAECMVHATASGISGCIEDYGVWNYGPGETVVFVPAEGDDDVDEIQYHYCHDCPGESGCYRGADKLFTYTFEP